MAVSKGLLKKEKISSKAERVYQDIPNNQLPEIVLQKTMASTMREFIKFTGEKFQKEIHDQDVRDTNNLYESVLTRVSAGSSKITGSVDFNFYGRFVDMGVGKGVTLMEKQTGRGLTANRNPSRIARHPRPWFSKVWFEQRHRLQEVLARDIAKKVGDSTRNSLSEGTLPVKV
jgi:hypothetical protein